MPHFLKGPVSSVHTPQSLAAPHSGFLGVLLRHPRCASFLCVYSWSSEIQSSLGTQLPSEPLSFRLCLFSTQQTQGLHRPPFCSTSPSGCKQKPSQWLKHWFSVFTVQDWDLLGDCENTDCWIHPRDSNLIGSWYQVKSENQDFESSPGDLMGSIKLEPLA